MNRTIPRLFEDSVSRFGPNPFLWEKVGTVYQSASYRQVREQVYQLMAAFIRNGLKPGDRVALISEGRNYWVIAELAILYAGAVNVPLSIKLEAETEIRFRIEHSGARWIIVSGNQAPKIALIRPLLNEVDRVIFLDPKQDYALGESFIEDWMQEGREWLAANPGLPEKQLKGIHESDLANICYTSGTTADPKGIILTHLNYWTNVEQSISLMDIPSYFKTLCILPLDHSFAHTAAIYSFMKMGASLGTVQIGKSPNETLRNIPLNIKEFKPHLILSVPTLAKNFRKNIEKGIRDKGPFATRLFETALKMSFSYYGDGFRKPGPLQFWKKPILKIFDKLLFSKIREAFGGDLRFFIGGGAMLDIDLQKFFYAIGIPMFQGYGLSEASPIISSNAPQRHKLGSSGFLVDGLELRIVGDQGQNLPVGEKGEIVVRGGNVMAGYWKNETATREALREGWLHTGDMGYLDRDGFLFVLGRFKSLLIGNDGEKYSPEGIEEALTEHCTSIDQILLHNNQNPYTVALIVPNMEGIRRKLAALHIDSSQPDWACMALKTIQEDISRFKNGGSFAGWFPERWLPTTFAVLPEAFTEQNHFMNSTLKLVRAKITGYYARRLDDLFLPEGKDPCHGSNQEVIRQLAGRF